MRAKLYSTVTRATQATLSRVKRTRPNKLQLFIQKLIGRPLPKLRLSHQLIGFFGLIVLVPLLLLTLSIYSINQKAVKKQVTRFTEHAAQSAYDGLNLEMSWQKEEARLAANYWMTMLTTVGREGQQNFIQQFFTDHPDFVAVALYPKNGSTPQIWIPTKQPEKLEFGDILRQHLPPQTNKIKFQLNHHPKAEQPIGLNYSLQVTIPPNQIEPAYPLGTLVFIKRFPYMSHMVSDQYAKFEQGFVVVNQNGTVIAGPNAFVGKQISEKDQSIFNRLTEGVTKSFTSDTSSYGLPPNALKHDKDDDLKLEKVFVKIPELGWSLIIESPYSLKRSFITTARLQSVGLAFLCIVIIVVLGLLYSRGINRNFRQLIKGIKALAEGRYSRKIRLITKSWTPYEIIFLTAEFNRMAGKISAAWNNIQELNQELVYKNQQDVFITQATQRLHSSLSIDTVCQTATNVLCEQDATHAASIFLLQEDDRFDLEALSAQENPTQFHGALTHLAGKNLLFENTLKTHHPSQLPPEELPNLDTTEYAAWAYPIYYQGKGLGVITLVRSKTTTGPGNETSDTMVLDLILSQIGVAIYQSRQWQALQKANEQLSKLDELKSNLIDTVSHELRTPLTNIKGYTSRLIRNDESLDAPTKLKSLKVIKQQADRLGRLVEDLLVIPDLERGGIRVFPDRVDLNDLLNRCITFMTEKIGHPLNTQLPASGLAIIVDPDRMEQVILNLLDNAIKYTTQLEAVSLKAYPTLQGTMRIEVFNPCEPIPPEQLTQLFNKFTRLDERTTRTTRGTGLGLFITKGLVEAMGGHIWIEGHEGFRVCIEVPVEGKTALSLDETHPFSQSAL